MALAIQRSYYEEIIRELNETSQGLVSCDSCYREDVAGMGTAVGQLSDDVLSYQNCKASDVTLTQIDTIEVQLATVATYMNETSVSAWSNALQKASAVLSCADVPVQFCTGVTYTGQSGNFIFCTVDASGNCTPITS
jgi:hypothetical protein